MDTRLVNLADRYSRKRAWLAAIAAAVFLAGQLVTRPPVFAAGPPGTLLDWWAVAAILLLLVLATGGGLLNPPRVRALVHDELARDHLRTAVVVGYWVGAGLGLVLYLAPWAAGLTGRQAVFVVVTGSVTVPLVTFAVLEARAHRDD